MGEALAGAGLGVSERALGFGGKRELFVSVLVESAEPGFELADEPVGFLVGEVVGCESQFDGGIARTDDLGGEAGLDGVAELVAVEVDREPAELGDALGPGLVVASPAGELDDEVAHAAEEVFAGLDPLGVLDAADLHGEPVAAGVDPVGDGVGEAGGTVVVLDGFVAGPGDGFGEAVLVAAVGAGEPFEFGELGLHAGLFDDEGIAVARALTLA